MQRPPPRVIAAWPLPYPGLLHRRVNPPLPEGFSLVQPVPAAAGAGPIDQPREISARLAACWAVPGAQEGRHLEVSVKLSFRADGAIIGAPFITYVKAPGGVARENIAASIRKAIAACTPLRFTTRLGAAIAGRVFLIRFISNPAQPKDIAT